MINAIKIINTTNFIDGLKGLNDNESFTAITVEM